MSATAGRAAHGVRSVPSAAGWCGVVGIAMLAVRPAVRGDPAAVPILIGTYVVLGAMCVCVPLGGSREPAATLRPAFVMGLGLAAVGVVAIFSTAAPFPHGGSAVVLGVLAAVSEEALFRRVIYAALSGWGPSIALVGSALLFASVHLPVYGPAAFPVDLGAGLLLSWQRSASGGWAASATTHAFANILAVLR